MSAVALIAQGVTFGFVIWSRVHPAVCWKPRVVIPSSMSRNLMITADKFLVM